MWKNCRFMENLKISFSYLCNLLLIIVHHYTYLGKTLLYRTKYKSSVYINHTKTM